ncbi:DUF2513 domain-containing protein [Paenibacillus barcinonensis]|uniref:DUF2513 domain-containing protein n=1 Tax=Paenibacillus barcinonensis TaxID=198119 RepID=A0A2V4VVM3_PAEBA|nr:DUF2513 domain-containing protein [Paenibacillus barcinonensis]PYE51507.1 uncharacterized protein DUF2513 [Paenibacillus barcinonensis]QKS55890.1 DUF2513 domain-containing protein [Paenibacillus barcinonensis]
MKRDMELIINILKCIEEGWEENFEEYFAEVEDYHFWHNVWLTRDFGLIETQDFHSLGKETTFTPTRITWEGHDFLDAARSEAVVSEAKEIAKKKGLDFLNLPYELTKSLLVEVTKGALFS